MSLKKYRQVDILILTVIAIVCEVVGYLAHMRYPDAGFYLSFSILLCMIAMLRWGIWGCIVYPVAGLFMVFTAQSGQVLEKILMYPVANCFIVLSIIMFRVVKRDDIRLDAGLTVLYVLVCYLSIAIGKGFGLLLLGERPIQGMALYLLAELFNIIMVFIVMLFLRKRDGLMRDMPTYLQNNKKRMKVI